jgi:hypothetical protein
MNGILGVGERLLKPFPLTDLIGKFLAMLSLILTFLQLMCLKPSFGGKGKRLGFMSSTRAKRVASLTISDTSASEQ